MSDWSRGYDVSLGYSFGFYREMGPDWLDLCVRVNGWAIAERRKSYRYLELGAGQGFGLCLLAAANPRAEFVGVDFQPEHVEHARGLADAAGLTNVRFIKVDFADLAQDWPQDFGTFDYVVLHGIISWVAPVIRQAVVSCLHHSTHSGSLVYASYNAQPSWLGSVPFQHITRLLKATTGKASDEIIEESITLFEQLQRSNAPGFQILPALGVRLATLRSHSTSYLVHEYLNDHWQPLWHSQIADMFRKAELEFAGSATVADNLLPALLPKQLREPVAAQTDSRLRQDLQDFAVNQGFRRDIFFRGVLRPASSSLQESLSATRFCLLVQPPNDRDLSVPTSFQTITLLWRQISPLLAALADGPKMGSELLALMSPTAEPAHTLVLLLQAGVIACAAADPGPAHAAERFNAAVASRACEGMPYQQVAAATTGSAIALSRIELTLLDAWLASGTKPEPLILAQRVADRLHHLGEKLYRHGQLVEGAELEAQIQTLVSIFMDEVLPKWRKLGVLT